MAAWAIVDRASSKDKAVMMQIFPYFFMVPPFANHNHYK